MIERGRPPRRKYPTENPFYQPRSSADSRKRRRAKKFEAPLPPLPPSPPSSFRELGLSLPHEHHKMEYEASSSTTRTIGQQQSPSVSKLYNDWQPFIAAHSSPSRTQDGEAQLSLPDNGSRGIRELPSPSSPCYGDDQEAIPGSRRRDFRQRAPEKASFVSRPEHEEEQLGHRYRFRGLRLEKNRAMSDRALSPDKDSAAGRRLQNSQRSTSFNLRAAPHVGDWVTESRAQPGFPCTKPISRPPSIIETIPESPNPRNSTRLSGLASVIESSKESRDPTLSKPASRPASTENNNKKRSDRKTSRREYKQRLFEEALEWNLQRPEDLKKEMCFDDDDSPKPFQPWSPDRMKEEWIRREYYVLSGRMLNPKPTPVFGTAKWYDLDRLRCFTNLNGHHGHGKVTWPEGYKPRYPKGAAAWNPKDDYSVFLEGIAFDDGTESIKSSMASSNYLLRRRVG
ncbi:MAG: hypothetical protein Q9171_001793 [Xanthocarpia ochracea]